MERQFASLIVALLFNLVTLEAEAAVGIKVDPNKPTTNVPTLDHARNGVPVVNIATPTAGGVSHNKFKDYNVKKKGVVINNSIKDGRSQLGGVLYGNPNLITGQNSANVVLFEVTGTNKSQLQGYTEMFGHSAEFILANPHGIVVNGAGFINTPRVILSTGVPELDASGRFKGLNVEQGDIRIEGEGLNASNVDYFDIIARTINIHAAIWGKKELSLKAGRNYYDHIKKTLTAKSENGDEKPVIAIDASALGSMYAGRIHLVSTEAGVGVKTASNLAATVDDIVIKSNGDIAFNTLSAANNINVDAAGNVKQVSSSFAKNNVTITAKGDIDLRDSLTSAEGNIRLEAQSIDNSNTNNTDSYGNPIKGILANGDLEITVTDKLSNAAGNITGFDNVIISSFDTDNADGIIQAYNDLTINNMRLNQGKLLARNNINLQLNNANRFTNEGLIQSFGTAGTGTINIQAGDAIIDNSQGNIESTGNLSLTTTQEMTNDYLGNYSVNGTLGINALRMTNTGTITTGGINFVFQDDFLNQSKLQAERFVKVETKSGDLVNAADAEIIAKNKDGSGYFELTSGANISNEGVIGAGDGVGQALDGERKSSIINASNGVVNNQKQISSAGDLTINHGFSF